jgi:hypothetical protein
MVAGTVLPAWQARTLELLGEVPGVEPALLIVDARARPSGNPRERARRLVRSEAPLWKAYNDGWVARRAAASRPVDCHDRLGGLPRLECTVTKRGKWTELFTDADVDAIESHDLDFVLRFAFGIIRGRVLGAARYGVWSFHHDDEQVVRGGPPCFWEVFDGHPVSGVILQRLTERLDAGVVLQRGAVRTVGSSYARNTDAVHFAGASFPAKTCREVLAGHTASLDAAPAASDAPVRRNPTNRQMLTFLRRQAGTYLAGQVRSTFFRDQWNVGMVDAPITRFLEPGPTPAPRWFAEPGNADVYHADPFGVPGHDDVLVEAFDQVTQEGTISTAAGGGAPVLDVGVHASYPYLVEDGGAVYCLPEVARSRAVRLFRARCFPREWDDLGPIVDGVAAVDPTVVRHGDRWWLFFTDREVDANAVLHVWHAPALLGPWAPHATNPVKTDARSARPAGTPFVHDGRLYRPAQDCSETYGGAVVLNEVVELTPTRFEERVVATVPPFAGSRYPAGCHTLSAVGDRTLVDGKRRVLTGRLAAATLARKLRRKVGRAG